MGCNDRLTRHAYDALLQRLVGGAIVLMHSQGGNSSFIAAATAPGRVRAVISLDPSGAPDPAEQDASRLKDVPHLFVRGDHLDRHSFRAHSRPNVERWRDALLHAGCDVSWIELLALGIEATATHSWPTTKTPAATA